MKTIAGKIQSAGGKYQIIASTPDQDRDNEIILPSAFTRSLSPYLERNPVILWAHRYDLPPIAKATGGEVTETDLRLDIQFAETAAASEIRSLYDGGFLNAFSVGFIPKQGHRDNDGVYTFDEVELLEVSAVPVPSNRGAVLMREAAAKGIKINAAAEMLNGLEITELSENPGIVDEISDLLREIEHNRYRMAAMSSRQALVYEDGRSYR